MNASIKSLDRGSTPALSKLNPTSAHLTRYRLMITYRFALALFGGYALAAFAAMFIAEYFSEYRGSAAMSATLIAFSLQAGTFIWVFMVNKTLKATLGIVIPTLMFYLLFKSLG